MKALILAMAILIGSLLGEAFAKQTDPPSNMPNADVQALTSQLQGAGCNAALNAAAAEIVKLRKQVAELESKQMVGKSGPTKH